VKEGNGLLFDVVVFFRVVFLTNCSRANYGRWRKNSVRYTHVESTVVSVPKQMCTTSGTRSIEIRTTTMYVVPYNSKSLY
jgi:hypothetical protein